MKKVLLASTALVLTAGVAAAEVEVTGAANMGLQYIEGGFAGEEIGMHYELDFNVVGSGTTDNGLTFGASLDLDLDDGTTTNTISDPEVFLEGTFGRLTFGNVDSASDNLTLGISDVGFDGIGIDDDSDTFIGAGDANVVYSGTFADFAVVLSTSLADSTNSATGGSSGDFGVGVGYAFGDYEVAAAYERVSVGGDNNDENYYYLGFQGNAGSFAFDTFVHYAEEQDITAGGVFVEFAAGNGLAITGGLGVTDIDNEDIDVGIGFEYDLGGAILAGGAGTVDDNVVADLGFNFAF